MEWTRKDPTIYNNKIAKGKIDISFNEKLNKNFIKNLTDYGAFIDLGGIDGLLHITDISWKKIKHPSELLNIAEKILGYTNELKIPFVFKNFDILT